MKDENVGAFESTNPSKKETDERIVVKKYANRRLYNTATSSYVTLDNLAAMIRGGQDFVVQDAKTGDDITRSVLTQIIFEEEAKGREPLLPTSFLRQLIRLYGDAVRGYVPSYLETAMEAFERNQETLRAHMERSFGVTPGFAQFDVITRANMEMFRNAVGMFSPFVPGGANPTGAAASAEAGASDDVAPTTAELEAHKLNAAPSGFAPVTSGPKAGSDDDHELAALKRQLAEMQRRVDAALSK